MQQGLGTLLERVTNSHPRTAAIAGCLLCTGTYVGLLYLWRGMPRNHPSTIRRRMLSVGAACSVAWVPLRLALPKVRPQWQLLQWQLIGCCQDANPSLAKSLNYSSTPMQCTYRAQSCIRSWG